MGGGGIGPTIAIPGAKNEATGKRKNLMATEETRIEYG